MAVSCRCFGLASALSLLFAVEMAVTGAEFPKPGANIDVLREIVFPKSSAVVDIKKAPYNAKGDGQTDDTDAIQRAVTDTMGQRKVLYFPEGTYVISKTIQWSKKNSAGNEAWGFNFLQGQNAFKTILRLKDATLTDAKNPQSMMWCGGFGSADWFHNYVQDISFDVGRDNPGAIGLQFYSNNTGAVRNCRFLADHGSGIVGLDLGHRDMNGPLLVRNCEVAGFQRGISTSRAVNGQTFEQMTLRGQSRFGLENEGQAISIRGLLSENAVPAVQTYGTFCLIDSHLTGKEGAREVPAVINYNGGKVFLRDVKTSGYARALGDVATPDAFAARQIQGPDKPGSEGPDIGEYSSHPATQPFPSRVGSLRLPVKETPDVPWDPLNQWANVDDFGADPTGNADSTNAIQKAVDSGATTVFFPGSYRLTQSVFVRGKVRRLLGTGGWIDYHHEVKPDFVIEDGPSDLLAIEHFAPINGGISVKSSRTIVLRSMEVSGVDFGDKGDVFFEDVVTNGLQFQAGQKVWGRQLNVENEGTHLSNAGGQLWVLGYKTERGGTLLKTRQGGSSEILGGFSYTTTAGKLAPMFVTENSSVFAFFSEVCFTSDPFATLIHETRGREMRTILRGEGGTTPYVSVFSKD